jgi:predicted DNA binding CopG/RHH family protein
VTGGTENTNVSEVASISKALKARNKPKTSRWGALGGKIETKIRGEEKKGEEETADQGIEVSPIDDATGDNSNKHADDASSCRSDGDGMLNSADTSTAVGKKSSNWKLLKNGISFHHTKKQAETNDNSETKTEDFNLINEAQKHAEVFKSRKRSTNESLPGGDTAAMKSDASASVDKSDDFLLKQMTSLL